MSGRYHEQQKTFVLQASANAQFVWSQESCPFHDAQLWIAHPGPLTIVVDFVDKDGNTLGATTAANYTGAGAPQRVWALTGVLSSLFKPRATITNPSGSVQTGNIMAAFIGISYQEAG
jgi:hypothetical protein